MEPEQPTNHCPECHASLSPDAPEGLCPSCLLRQVAESTEIEPGSQSRPPAPSIVSLQEAFPELEIHELIGQGGMGAVFKATQRRMNRTVALKVLPEALARNPEFSERFTREAQFLARLSHPTIVTLYDFGERNGIFYLLMEYVDGVDLQQAMQASRFTPNQALKLIPHLCDALEYAHQQGVLHRDIKPANILLDTNGTVKLADFGIAKLGGPLAPETALTQTGGTLGSPHYMAPEQIEKPSEVDHRADIYSLGVVLYEMLTGELPIGRFAAPSQKSQVGPGLDSIVLRALEKEREARQQSAGEMRSQVETVSASSGLSAHRVSDESPDLPTTLNPILFWLIGSVLSSLILFVGYDILKLIAAYFELLQNLSIYQDHHFFLRVAFEGTVVTASLVLVWNYRSLLVRSFPLRHPTYELSLYPIALTALLIALIPPVRGYAILLGSYGRTLPLLAITIILSLAIIRIAVPSGRGFQRSRSSRTLGMTFLWMGILIPIVFRLLQIASPPVDSPPEVQSRLLNVTMPTALTLGWFSSLTLVVPIGLALLGQSRLWRKIAIFSSLWSLCGVSYTLYGLLSITSRLIVTSQNKLSFSLSFWLSNIITIIIPLLALSFLIRPRQLEHFGLEPRRSGYFPSISKTFKVAPKKLIRPALIIVGLFILGTGQVAYLFETGGNPIAKNNIESYSLEFLSDQIQTLQTPIRNNAENMITVLGVSNDRLGNEWWDKTGRPIPRPRHLPPVSPTIQPELSSLTHHILVRIVDSIPTPLAIEISLVSKNGIQPLVQSIDDRHRLLTFSVPRSTTGIQGHFMLTPSQNMAIAQGNTRREQQLSSTLKFHWKNGSRDAQQVIEWLAEGEWRFEMWAHSTTRSKSIFSDKIQREGDRITASFQEEIGPYSNFTLFARPTYRVTINGIALSPAE